MKFIALLTLATAFVLINAEDAHAADKNSLTFGVYTSDKPSDMYRKFKPILSAIEKQLKVSLGDDAKVKLQIYNSYEAALTAFVKGEVDFVRFGPASYILSKKQSEGIRLLAIEENGGKRRSNGVIFCRDDSPVKTIADLKGRSFAFGDDKSTVGRYLSQATLLKNDVSVKDLSQYKYLGRHDTVVTAVLHGRFDAGAAKEGTFKKYKDKGLRVIEKFDNATKPWAARAGLEDERFNALRDALLSITDKKALQSVGKKLTGLGKVDDDEYEWVRKGMEESESFFDSEEDAVEASSASTK